jgi:hypothetical protein
MFSILCTIFVFLPPLGYSAAHLSFEISWWLAMSENAGGVTRSEAAQGSGHADSASRTCTCLPAKKSKEDREGQKLQLAEVREEMCA